MHHAKNMVGERKANYDVALVKRYFRLSKHSKPGRIKKALVGFMTAVEIKIGVIAYA